MAEMAMVAMLALIVIATIVFCKLTLESSERIKTTMQNMQVESEANKDALAAALGRVELLEIKLKVANDHNAIHAAMLSDRSEVLGWVMAQLTAGERVTFGDFRGWTSKHGYPEPEKPDREYNPPTAWRRDYESVIKKKQ